MMPPTESSPHLKIEFAQASDAGRDPNKQVNEDSCGYAETQFGYLCVLCDGMGGHYGGSEASRTAIKTIFEMIEHTPAAVGPSGALKAAIEEAGRRVYQLGGPPENRVRPGSTVVAMILHDRGVDVAHVGDSRAYVIRSHQIYPLTRDHSMVQGMIDAGMITEAQAIGHPDANKITRALGMKPEVEVEVRPEPMELYPGDVLIQSSDGLTDLVLAGDILGCTRQALASGSVDHACRMLVQLANHRGGHDNITVQMVRVLETGSRSLTIAHGPPGAAGPGDGAGPARASRPQETVAMTRPEAAAIGPQHATSTPLPHGHGAPAAASGAAAAGKPPAPYPASINNAITVVPTGSSDTPRPASINNAITVVPAGSIGTPGPRPASTSNAATSVSTGSDDVPAVAPTATDNVPVVARTATDNVPAVAPGAAAAAAAHGAPALRPTIDSTPAVSPTATDELPPVAPAAAPIAPAVSPTAADSGSPVTPTPLDSALALPPTVPGAHPPVAYPNAPDAPAVLSPLPLSAPAAAPMGRAAPPQPGSFGAPPHPGAAYGAPPHRAAPYGAPHHPGAAYGVPPPPGAPYGAPHPPGAAYGAPAHVGAAYGAPLQATEQDVPPPSVAFPGHNPAAPGGPPVAAAPPPHLAPAPLHAHAYAATGPRPAPAPSFSGPVSSSGASSVPTTVRAPRGVYIALIASAAAVILVLFVFLLWKLLGS
ncbi:protein phosphatase 2C domain-containing protein [Sorangium sp. So ce381]|uniref:PP2C family protein-serine/threonine phosphatase n=1 Tax=Sorangium sp. So ce381 TaxID=3133307 RepID=UPI003F5B5A09